VICSSKSQSFSLIYFKILFGFYISAQIGFKMMAKVPCISRGLLLFFKVAIDSWWTVSFITFAYDIWHYWHFLGGGILSLGPV
jgi:hypothetical protein